MRIRRSFVLPIIMCQALLFLFQVSFSQDNPAKVRIEDPFWSPKFKTWTTKTVYDVFDKFEGKYEPDRKDLIEEKQKLGRTRDAFLNFDRVARGEKNTKQ